MNRPVDWLPLAAHDPIPGDPGTVRWVADRYQATADHIDAAAQTLLQVSDGVSMRSDAIDAFVEKAKTVRTSILQTRSRYAGAAAVLHTYSTQLDSAQAQSVALLVEAKREAADQSTARHRAQYFDTEAQHATDPVGQKLAMTEMYKENSKVTAAAGRIHALQSRLQAVIDQRNTAADTAVQQIVDVEDESAIHGDTTVDKMKHAAAVVAQQLKAVLDAVADALVTIGKFIWDHLSEISLALTVLAVVFSLIPPLTAAAPALFLAARIVGAAATAKANVEAALKTGTAWYKVATGQMSITEASTITAGSIAGAIAGRFIGKAGKSVLGGLGRNTGNRIGSSVAQRSFLKTVTKRAEGTGKSVTNSYNGHLGAAMRHERTEAERKLDAKIKEFVPTQHSEGAAKAYRDFLKPEVNNRYLLKHGSEFEQGAAKAGIEMGNLLQNAGNKAAGNLATMGREHTQEAVDNWFPHAPKVTIVTINSALGLPVSVPVGISVSRSQ